MGKIILSRGITTGSVCPSACPDVGYASPGVKKQAQGMPSQPSAQPSRPAKIAGSLPFRLHPKATNADERKAIEDGVFAA
jgi:hypothetical protein